MSRIRRSLEYHGTRWMLRLLPLLPRGGAVRLARFGGWAAYYLAGHLRRTGRENLEVAFGDSKSARDKKEILMESFQTFALTLLDLFWFSGRDAEARIRKYVHVNEESLAILGSVGAAICLTAHAGNWELLGKSISLHGYPLSSVAAPLKNQRLDALFNRIRSATGQVIIPKRGALRALIKTLREGGRVALLLDQNTKPTAGGVFLDFFGLPVPVSTIGASLVHHTGARIYFGVCLADREGYYHLSDPVEVDVTDIQGEDREHLVFGITSRILAAIESYVATHPGAWLWMYKRWKYVAPGRLRSEYPFYAKEDYARRAGHGA